MFALFWFATDATPYTLAVHCDWLIACKVQTNGTCTEKQSTLVNTMSLLNFTPYNITTCDML